MRHSSVKTTSFHSAAHILLSSHQWRRRHLWFYVKGRPSNGCLADRPLCCKRRRMGVAFTEASNVHWCAKIKDEVEKLAYQLNEETERTERPIRRLSKMMCGITCLDMQVDVMGECLSSIKHVVGVRSVFLAKRLHAV
ncbi:uncharacterized protein TNCV_4095291 [Trichonephila clavipes]|uniref:Uncharacterized protein n=1 Tax=Trichonephila clavipes TaxID=2585209 RepID=A0A8X6VHM7_TRICX|nr:uncharacterized protein TNCV_4095291 [Trichonephila clavipes]